MAMAVIIGLGGTLLAAIFLAWACGATAKAFDRAMDELNEDERV